MTDQHYKTIIFLTGCINPEGMMFTALQDPAVRREQYINAIRFYLNKTCLPLLFVENSGTNVSDVFQHEISNGRLEVITFRGNQFDRKLGKGFGEMLILEKALEDSKFLKSADFVFKITGRYQLLNITSFIDQYRNQDKLDLLVDLRQQLQYADSRFWGSTVRFLKEVLLGYKHKVNDSENYFFEHALCHATHEAIAKKYVYSCLQQKPRYKGTYATTNEKYRHSLLSWLPGNIKQMIRYKAFS